MAVGDKVWLRKRWKVLLVAVVMTGLMAMMRLQGEVARCSRSTPRLLNVNVDFAAVGSEGYAHPTTTSSPWTQRAFHQVWTMLRHTPSIHLLSHADMQTSTPFPLTVGPSPPPSFDDLQQHSHRLSIPQPAPHQHYDPGNLDLHVLTHALLQPRNWR